MPVVIEFIRHQVEPEVVDDLDSPVGLYGHTRQVRAYKPGFSGMPLVWGDSYPAIEDADGGRVQLIGA